MVHFQPLLERAASAGRRVRLAVAGASDDFILQAVRDAEETLDATAILSGPGDELREATRKHGLDAARTRILPVAGPEEAVLTAIEAVRSGEADVLVKGMVPTAVLMKAVLDPEKGLRGHGLLSHVAVFDTPGYERMLFVTDGGLNIVPGLGEKAAILENAVSVATTLLGRQPKAAVLAAVEVVNPGMPATVEAAALAKMAERGQIKGVVVEGPLALDGAVNPDAARHKGIRAGICGDADILLVPSIEVGNILSKAITYFAGGIMAGVVVGGRVPVVLTSRADSSESKLASISVAAVLARSQAEGARAGES